MMATLRGCRVSIQKGARERARSEEEMEMVRERIEEGRKRGGGTRAKTSDRPVPDAGTLLNIFSSIRLQGTFYAAGSPKIRKIIAKLRSLRKRDDFESPSHVPRLVLITSPSFSTRNDLHRVRIWIARMEVSLCYYLVAVQSLIFFLLDAGRPPPHTVSKSELAIPSFLLFRCQPPSPIDTDSFVAYSFDSQLRAT